MDQNPDIDPFGDLVLNWKGIGAGIPDVAGKTCVSIIKGNNPQADPTATVILAGLDVVNSNIAVLIAHRVPARSLVASTLVIDSSGCPARPLRTDYSVG
jgi:hypothetical protein